MRKTLAILTVVFYVASAPMASLAGTGKHGCTDHGNSHDMSKAEHHGKMMKTTHGSEIPMTGHKMAMSGANGSCKHAAMKCNLNSHGKCDLHKGGCTIRSCSGIDGAPDQAFQFNSDIIFVSVPEVTNFGVFKLERGFESASCFAFSFVPDRPPIS